MQRPDMIAEIRQQAGKHSGTMVNNVPVMLIGTAPKWPEASCTYNRSCSKMRSMLVRLKSSTASQKWNDAFLTLLTSRELLNTHMHISMDLSFNFIFYQLHQPAAQKPALQPALAMVVDVHTSMLSGCAHHRLRKSRAPEATIDRWEMPRRRVVGAQVEIAVEAAASDVHGQLDQALHQRRVNVVADDVQLQSPRRGTED